MMRRYCKAYYLKNLRQFPEWKEILEEEEKSFSDDTIVYLWNDLTVVQNPVIAEKGIIWNTVTPQ